MKEALPGTLVAGIDISKDALGFAGRRLEGGAELAVASAYDLPFGDGTFDCAALLFSPFAKEEILRVLSKDGVLLMAIPGKRHLWALKSLLYETPYENLLSEFEIEGFSLMAQRHIAYEKTFAGQTLRNLFAMTPYYYRTPKAGVERACATESLKVELEFHLLCYKKL
jgi:23S rRNA (guanine745-N1)-methyltransferase